MLGTVAELTITGEISWWLNGSDAFTQQLAALRAAGVTELRGYINSGGGDLFEGNEIYNQISAFPGRKTCTLGALCASAATVIACAFTDGIEMAANGQYMIHNPVVGANGGERELLGAAQLYRNIRAAAIAAYVARTGLDAATVGEMMDATTWLSAGQAKELGFITAITGEVPLTPEAAATVANSTYRKVPPTVQQAVRMRGGLPGVRNDAPAPVVARDYFVPGIRQHLRVARTWADGLADESRMVGNNVIHLAEIGADPAVLLNNTVYPIATSEREDAGVTVALAKYETTNTRISEEELYGLAYDKPTSALTAHRDTLAEGMLSHGLWALAPPAPASRTPVRVTTGLLDVETGRLRLCPGDLIALARGYDDAKVPTWGRRLVLCPDHAEDLLGFEGYTSEWLADVASGQVRPLVYGFELHRDFAPPSYALATRTRTPYGTVPNPTTDSAASVAFWAPRCFRALGDTTAYARQATLDPEGRASVIGFRQWGLVLPYARDSQAALLSGRLL